MTDKRYVSVDVDVDVDIIYWRITLKAESRKKDAINKLNTII